MPAYLSHRFLFLTLMFWGCLFDGHEHPLWAGNLEIVTFNENITPKLGMPVAYAPARKILTPLYARGVVILSDEKPVVLCAVDAIGIGNQGYNTWREKLAEAAATTPDRVAVHSLHQHDAPRIDFATGKIMEDQGLGGKNYDNSYGRQCITQVANAIRSGLKNPQTVTHLGIGKAKVEQVASNRRLLGADGKVRLMRWSKSKSPEAINAPEGVIDPWLKCLCFWNQDHPIAVLNYYATHPQSYYGKGDVNYEFTGMAREARNEALPGTLNIYFNGAAGNIAAGKYNDGSTKMRPLLAQRVERGMESAFKSQKKTPISSADLHWKTEMTALPVATHLDPESLKATIIDQKRTPKERSTAAFRLVWYQRASQGHQIPITCLHLKSAAILHLPGELFIEYQLQAQKFAPKQTVCLAAYGDYGPGYICTEIAYSQGGYESSPRASQVAPHVESVLTEVIRRLVMPEENSKK
ncbi:MAG: hypothetical protein CME31_02955 [Gimesia sp.]|uniref:Neutral/alkaline non-lysosomal ceramidase n=1 Tax=Gimesia maris TaxID=122 RepID=A0A3D3R836_9PLAN|nr:hypothetical protein [Gimesia sp.]HCO23780.1 hypothetical protein [Gimesia maris]|tara:strand:+ start:58083 stop:59483 length:1401 start_codon:yes stop_codon:yes gene_type:complete